jgi:O-antigen/teichoic acid export membrane protein
MMAVEYFLTKLLKNKYINNKKEIDVDYWKKSSRSFILISASYLILSHIDVLMIGILLDKEQSGIYGIASRIAALVAYGLYVSNIILMPHISSLYTEKRYLSLEKILRKISRYNFIIAGLIFIIIYIFRYELLQLFGNNFTNGETVLIILCFAQILNVIAGSVGALMTMSGNENYLSSVMLFSVLLNIVFNSLLIPKMGIEGAALATGLSIIFWNYILLMHTNKIIGINPSIVNVKWMKS